MPGRHQLQNAMTTLRTVSALRERGWNIPVEAAVRGLARARMPGRLERLSDQPLVLLDGANGGRGIMATGALALLDGAGNGPTTMGGGALTLLDGADGGLALVYIADGGQGRGLKD